MKRKIIVGYNKGNYPERRNIINKLSDVTYIKVSNFKLIIINILTKYSISVLRKLWFKNERYNFYFNDFGLNKVDILHLFNYISHGDKPWVATFETIIPRSKESHKLLHTHKNDSSDLKKDKVILNDLSKLAGNPCKKLITLSDCNLKMQKAFLQHFPYYFKKIMPKLVCLHPPQKLFVSSWEEKQLSIKGQINFMFVGGQFYSKGGKEILEVFKELKKKYNLRLTIVSSLKTDTYASNTNEIDKKTTIRFFDKNMDWIDYYKYLPNQEVLSLMKLAHIGLLPTYADTYGYSVLEFQASGCPVITTNVRALPEINNSAIGWMIPVKKHNLGEGYYASTKERKVMSNLIKKGLKNTIEEIMENKSLIIEKSNNSLEHIKENHSPEKFSMKLKEIYREALN